MPTIARTLKDFASRINTADAAVLSQKSEVSVARDELKSYLTSKGLDFYPFSTHSYGRGYSITATQAELREYLIDFAVKILSL